MKAFTLTQIGGSAMVDIPEPVLGAEDVLVELAYIGLCGTDLKAFRGESPFFQYPRIPGHEISGVIITKGPRVPERIPLGARVTVSPYTECGLCPACRAGRPNTCQFNQTLGSQRDGALCERIAIHYSKVFPSQQLTLQELALVEPLSVGYHAANRARVNEADTVLVLGCGTIGMGAVAAAANKGATVIALDIDDAKLAQARSLGAAETINSAREDPVQRVAELTGTDGVSVAIEAVGHPETVRQAIELASFAGRVALIGYTKDSIPLPARLIVSKELDVYGSRNALRVFPAVIRMLEGRRRPFTGLITCAYPFEQAGAALADWNAAPQRFTKILIQMPGADQAG